LKITWKYPTEVFYQLYKQEVDAQIAKRWQALEMLRRGKRLKQVQEIVGVAVGEVVWGWGYEVGRHRLGSGARGMEAGARAEDGGGGIGRAVSDDRGGGGVV
jgi:hypothetical protein